MREVPWVMQEERKLSWGTIRKFGTAGGGGKKIFLNLQLELIKGCSSCVDSRGQRVKS